MLKIFPWQQLQWQQLVSSWKSGRFGHALLLYGPNGIGLNHFALCTAAALLCRNFEKSLQICGECHSCKLFNAGSHTDLLYIKPENDSNQIKVEQIRKLIEFSSLKSQFEGYKIIILSPANAMNRNAVNTLLKTLEEPPAQTLIILLSHRQDLLPITIKSRCQQIYFQPVFSGAVLDWLEQTVPDSQLAARLLHATGGAPLAARDMFKNNGLDKLDILIEDLGEIRNNSCDPVSIADKWNKLGAEQILLWLIQLIADLARVKSGGNLLRVNTGPSLVRLQQNINHLDLSQLVLCHELAMKNYSLCTGNVSYNTQGLLEDFVIYWQELETKAEVNQT